MSRILIALLTLFFLGGPAMGEYRDFRLCTLAAKELPALRQAYVSSVKGLADLGVSARAAGQNAEATARLLYAERNALKIQYRQLGPADAAKQFELRNIEKYGNPVGPTIEQLRGQGKTWEQIIESASRPGGSDLGF